MQPLGRSSGYVEERLISPLAIRFTEELLQPQFQDGTPFETTLSQMSVVSGDESMRYTRLIIAPFPCIEIFRVRAGNDEDPSWLEMGGKPVQRRWATSDNKRLCCLQRVAAAQLPRLCAAVVRVVDASPSDGVELMWPTDMASGLKVHVGSQVNARDVLMWNWLIELKRRCDESPNGVTVQEVVKQIQEETNTPPGGLYAAPRWATQNMYQGGACRMPQTVSSVPLVYGASSGNGYGAGRAPAPAQLFLGTGASSRPPQPQIRNPLLGVAAAAAASVTARAEEPAEINHQELLRSLLSDGEKAPAAPAEKAPAPEKKPSKVQLASEKLPRPVPPGPVKMGISLASATAPGASSSSAAATVAAAVAAATAPKPQEPGGKAAAKQPTQGGKATAAPKAAKAAPKAAPAPAEAKKGGAGAQKGGGKAAATGAPQWQPKLTSEAKARPTGKASAESSVPEASQERQDASAALKAVVNSMPQETSRAPEDGSPQRARASGVHRKASAGKSGEDGAKSQAPAAPKKSAGGATGKWKPKEPAAAEERWAAAEEWQETKQRGQGKSRQKSTKAPSLKALEGEWWGDKGEHYQISAEAWRCWRNKSGVTKKYTLAWDETIGMITWGSGKYLLDPKDFQDVDYAYEVNWYESERGHLQFTWTR
eukprot:TRINITY_DN2844_c0_g2_i1.p1 TRINITY_DN2844_c0_g2~~TRINITY_DN2844_c0_g2_i1.p1  ORF type:complete len:653 (-),score=154.02 TRINITY_DN2844_c0_g2_i1:77-2035(-)